jgi:hypothetical protein
LEVNVLTILPDDSGVRAGKIISSSVGTIITSAGVVKRSRSRNSRYIDSKAEQECPSSKKERLHILVVALGSQMSARIVHESRIGE